MTAIACLDVTLPAPSCAPARGPESPTDPWLDFESDLDRITPQRTRADRQRRVIGFAAAGVLALTALAVWQAFRAPAEPAATPEPIEIEIEHDGSATIGGELWCDPSELPTAEEIPPGLWSVTISHPADLGARAEQIAASLRTVEAVESVNTSALAGSGLTLVEAVEEPVVEELVVEELVVEELVVEDPVVEEPVVETVVEAVVEGSQ